MLYFYEPVFKISALIQFTKIYNYDIVFPAGKQLGRSGIGNNKKNTCQSVKIVYNISEGIETSNLELADAYTHIYKSAF